MHLQLLNTSNSHHYQLQINNNHPLHIISNNQKFLPTPISIKQLSLTPNKHHKILININNNNKISITYNKTTNIINHIHNFFKPSNILISTLILTLHPTNLLPLITNNLPIHLLPTKIITNSPIHNHNINLNNNPNINKQL